MPTLLSIPQMQPGSPVLRRDSVRAAQWCPPTLGGVTDDIQRKARLAYALRHARERRGLSVEELAAAIGRNRGTIYDWEGGKTAPSLLDLGPLCTALLVDPRLFADLPAPPDPVPSPVDDYLLVQEATLRGIVRAQGPKRGRRGARPTDEGSGE